MFTFEWMTPRPVWLYLVEHVPPLEEPVESYNGKITFTYLLEHLASSQLIWLDVLSKIHESTSKECTIN